MDKFEERLTLRYIGFIFIGFMLGVFLEIVFDPSCQLCEDETTEEVAYVGTLAEPVYVDGVEYRYFIIKQINEPEEWRDDDGNNS